MKALEKIRLGGVEQWISLRGDSTRLPILLSLHGGPGIPALPFLHRFCPGLEHSYLVVSWDQRGAGKSFSLGLPRASMNIEQFLADTRDLIVGLLERFGQDKLFLLGHSWGSALGIWTAQRHPGLLHAYVGVGQVSDRQRSEELSLRFTIERAKTTQNRWALAMLKMLGAPPWPAWKLIIQRYWLLKLGGAVYGKDRYDQEMDAFLKAKEYSWRDLMTLPIGMYSSLALLWKDFSRQNLEHEVPELAVPIYFLEGRHDQQVNVDCARQYFEALEAPRKKWVYFDYSAHSPMYEEPDRFVEIMVNEVLPETLPPKP